MDGYQALLMPSFFLLLLLVILRGSLKAAVCAVAHALSALSTAGPQSCSLLGCVLGKTLSSCVCGQGRLHWQLVVAITVTFVLCNIYSMYF